MGSETARVSDPILRRSNRELPFDLLPRIHAWSMQLTVYAQTISTSVPSQVSKLQQETIRGTLPLSHPTQKDGEGPSRSAAPPLWQTLEQEQCSRTDCLITV